MTVGLISTGMSSLVATRQFYNFTRLPNIRHFSSITFLSKCPCYLWDPWIRHHMSHQSSILADAFGAVDDIKKIRKGETQKLQLHRPIDVCRPSSMFRRPFNISMVNREQIEAQICRPAMMQPFELSKWSSVCHVILMSRLIYRAHLFWSISGNPFCEVSKNDLSRTVPIWHIEQRHRIYSCMRCKVVSCIHTKTTAGREIHTRSLCVVTDKSGRVEFAVTDIGCSIEIFWSKRKTVQTFTRLYTDWSSLSHFNGQSTCSRSHDTALRKNDIIMFQLCWSPVLSF